MKSENVDVNRHIGARLQLQRRKLRLSRREVGTWLDVSQQQIRNYEEGTNRMTADALFVLSREMNVDPGFFFEGLLGPHSKNSLIDSAAADYIVEPSPFSEGSRLDEAFARIRSRKQRVLAVRLVETVAETDSVDKKTR
jgi:transcriptional regulator with XRE-family HTH domain